MESDGIFEKRSLREMAKCRGFSSKGSGVMLWTSAGAFGTATQDKCKATHASPGPISSLIEMEHKFSVSRTKILLSWDDSWLMVHHHFLRCPCSRDWQVGPGSPKCTAEIIHSFSAASFLWCFYILRRTTSQKKIEKALDNWTNNWCPWVSGLEISALMTSCNKCNTLWTSRRHCRSAQDRIYGLKYLISI